jgi:hypothetical protein
MNYSVPISGGVGLCHCLHRLVSRGLGFVVEAESRQGEPAFCAVRGNGSLWSRRASLDGPPWWERMDLVPTQSPAALGGCLPGKTSLRRRRYRL